jgi:hypothetical protein
MYPQECYICSDEFACTDEDVCEVCGWAICCECESKHECNDN